MKETHERYILSIDQGTTSCRAIIFDTAGKPCGIGQREFTQFFPKPGWVEHDASEILREQIACIKEAVKNADVSAEQIACVGITNQRETTVVWNKKTGEPIHHAIVWQCRRTADIALSFKGDTDWFREKTGLMPDAYFSGPKIAWILDNVKGARDLAAQGTLAFGTIDSWLIWNLTEESQHLTEPSNASRTMLFNIKSLQWDNDLLKKLNVPANIMPQIVSSNANFGNTKKELVGFRAPILAVMGDQQAALFGQGCFEPGMAKCTYGTGSFLLANIGTKLTLTPGLLTTIAWKLENAPVVYALEGAIFVSGAAIQWLRDGLNIIESSDETEAIARSVESSDGVYFVPAFVGLGSPWWNPDVRGTITGLTRGTKRAHIVRAALEAMAFQVTDVVQDMTNHGESLKQLKIDGGATRNQFLVDFQADLLELPVVRSSQPEATAWGTAALAGITCGIIKNKEELLPLDAKNDVTMPQNNREREYKVWQQSLKAAIVAAE
ncbi:MAG: glycerol kinase GlpK [Candidatus Obscuribacterales bacterium]|nr:glycerol kinase GlpK [Candidatus Obscuribacterales bacterium]